MLVEEQRDQRQKAERKPEAEELRQEHEQDQQHLQHLQMDERQHKLAQERRQAEEQRHQAEEQQHRMQDQHQAKQADVARLRELLEGLELSNYADAIIAQGYDSAELVSGMTKAEVNELARVAGMTLGHKEKFCFFMVQQDLDDDEGSEGGPPAGAPPVVAETASAAPVKPQPIGVSKPATTLSAETLVFEGVVLAGWAPAPTVMANETPGTGASHLAAASAVAPVLERPGGGALPAEAVRV